MLPVKHTRVKVFANLVKEKPWLWGFEEKKKKALDMIKVCRDERIVLEKYVKRSINFVSLFQELLNNFTLEIGNNFKIFRCCGILLVFLNHTDPNWNWNPCLFTTDLISPRFEHPLNMCKLFFSPLVFFFFPPFLQFGVLLHSNRTLKRFYRSR